MASYFDRFIHKKLLLRLITNFTAVTLVAVTALALIFSNLYMDVTRDNLTGEYRRILEQKTA